jgi:hypothetical protein
VAPVEARGRVANRGRAMIRDVERDRRPGIVEKRGAVDPSACSGRRLSPTGADHFPRGACGDGGRPERDSQSHESVPRAKYRPGFHHGYMTPKAPAMPGSPTSKLGNSSTTCRSAPALEDRNVVCLIQAPRTDEACPADRVG